MVSFRCLLHAFCLINLRLPRQVLGNPDPLQFGKQQYYEVRNSSRVHLDYGDFIGARVGGIDSFRGLPYAEPPTRALRLQNPRPVTRTFPNFDATRLGPACPQQNMLADAVGPSPLSLAAMKLLAASVTPELKSQGTGQEDCLTLDVHRPAGLPESAKGLPVMFYIHGGSYVTGSSGMLPGQNLVAKSISLKMPMILVAANYRLGAFGFLGGRQVAKADVANLGLKDQQLAMQWVKKYIAKFGGDPHKVTIFGHSAGALSVSHHLYAFGGNSSLFRAAICQSGTAIPSHKLSSGAGQGVFDAIVKRVGCWKDTDQLSCLRKVNFTSLLAAENTFPGVFSPHAFPLSFGPLVDGKIVPDILTKKQVVRVPVISGTVDDEGTILSVGPSNGASNWLQVKKNFHRVYPNASPRVLDAFMRYYSKSYGSAHLESTNAFKLVSTLTGDAGFQARRRGFLRAAQNWTLAWGYNDVGLKNTPIWGAFHGSELGSVFGPPSDNSPRTHEFQARWISFAYNLSPNFPGLPLWQKYGSGTGKILQFDHKGSSGMIHDNYREGAMGIIISNPHHFVS